MTGLYNAGGAILTTTVNGSSYTGLYAPDGSWNIVINDGSVLKGRYHPCGALNAVIVSDPSAPAMAANGSLNVVSNASGGYSPVTNLGGGVAAVVPLGIVFDGDSITAGQSANTVPYPTYFSTLTAVRNKNLGVGGQTMSTMNTNYAANVAPLFATGLRDTLSILAGTNDIPAGATDLTLRATIQSYCGKARTTGFRVYVGTIISRNDAGWNATLEGYRVAYNTWLKANYASFCDGVIDFDATPQSTDPSNTTWFQDGLHPTNALAELFAGAVRSRLSVPLSSFAFNPTVPTGSATFSNSNKVFLTTALNTTVLGTTTVVGKKVFALALDLYGNYGMIGIGVNTPTNSAGFDGNKSIANFSNGNVYQNSSIVAAGVNFISPPLNMIAAVVDEPSSKLWFTADGVTFFGAGGSFTKAQVEAGTGAFDLSVIKAQGALYPVAGSFQLAGLKWRTEAYPAIPPAGYTQL